MGKHAKYSPSSGHRYMNCPPALLLEEQFPDEESPYAAEGTAGHKLAEHLIKKHLKIRSRRPTSDYYSDELLEAVDGYVQYVIEQIEEAKHICSDPVFSVEQKVDLSFHVKDCFGTADMVIVTDKKVHIIDLKLGKGVQVDAENNTQLMIYGLGMLDMRSLPERIRSTIWGVFSQILSNARLYSLYLYTEAGDVLHGKLYNSCFGIKLPI